VAWGLNDYGQANIPFGLSNVVAIAAGGRHSVVLKTRSPVSPPRLEITNRMIGDSVGLSLLGEPDVNYRIEASTNLLNWTPFTNFVSTQASNRFFDGFETNLSRRFYRAVAP
jgi:hypothetical protein